MQKVKYNKFAKGIREINKLDVNTLGMVKILDKQLTLITQSEEVTVEYAKEFIRYYRTKYCTAEFRFYYTEDIDINIENKEEDVVVNSVKIVTNEIETNKIGSLPNFQIDTFYIFNREDMLKNLIEGYMFSDIFGNKIYYDKLESYPFRLNDSILTNFFQFDGVNEFKFIGMTEELLEKNYKCYKNGVVFEIKSKNILLTSKELNLDKYELIK